MTEREMLEWAARAAGYQVEWFPRRCWCATRLGYFDAEDDSGYFVLGNHTWDPRRDPGQALELAVRLHLEIDHNHPQDNDAWVMAIENGKMIGPTVEVEDESQRLAATCLAITRAAATLGKSAAMDGEG